jgi:hypothetical protein
MWQLISEIRGYNCGYDFEYMRGDEVLPLDPIPNEVVGSVKLEDVMTQMAKEMSKWESTVRGIFEGDVGFQQARQEHIPTTAKKYAEHIDALHRCGILSDPYTLDHRRLHRWISGYFCVPKPPGNLSRSIFNGRAMSRMCRPPPCVNLFDIQAMLKLAGKHIGSFFTMDFRHWFHQLRWGKVSGALRNLFTIVFGNEAYTWLTLPMGWSYSPYLCQCISWFLVLHCESGEIPIFNTEDYVDRKEIPSHVRIMENGKSIGFVSITYDNVGVWCENADTSARIQSRIKRNTEIFNAIVKEDSVGSWTARSMSELGKRGRSATNEDARVRPAFPKFLGLEFCVRTTAGKRTLMWRIDEARMDVWKEHKYSKHSTNREVAQWCGRILRDAYVSLRPLFELENVIDVISAVGKLVDGKRIRWEDEYEFDDDTFAMMHRCWSAVLGNNWRANREAPKGEEQRVYLFTDASGTDGWGYVLADEEGRILDERTCPWTDAQRDMHIFVKEPGQPSGV